MGAAVQITRMEHTAAELRGLAAKSGGGAQVQRLLGLTLILDGNSREAAAEQCGMDRQTLRDSHDSPYFSDRSENVGEQRLFVQHLGEAFHERTQPSTLRR